MGAKKNAEKCEQGSGQGKQGINGNNWPHKEKWYWTNLKHSFFFFTSTRIIELKGNGLQSGTSDSAGKTSSGTSSGWLPSFASATYGLEGIDGSDMISKCLGPKSKWFKRAMCASSYFDLFWFHFKSFKWCISGALVYMCPYVNIYYQTIPHESQVTLMISSLGDIHPPSWDSPSPVRKNGKGWFIPNHSN